MATYKFENYTTDVGILTGEFVDPVVEVNNRTIITDDIDKTISCDITLVGTGYKVATQFKDMPRNGTGWDDSDLTTMIQTKLQEFAI